MMRMWLTLPLALLALIGLEAAGPVPVTFTDVSAAAGVRFVHNSGAAAGKKYLPETYGSGGLFLDVDNDGWQDILLVNATNWPGNPGPRSLAALYRNNHNGTFADITRGSGLDVEMRGVGGAAADFDNDGRVDVYVTGVGGGHLFRNIGGGKFADVTAAAGVSDAGWSTSALWFDYDNDGKLDLFVARYVKWDIANDIACSNNGRTKGYCGPVPYAGTSPLLFHNRGGGTFEDVTKQAGVFNEKSKGLGVAMLDYDGDGWMDFFFANDTQPNQLYRNNGNGTFTESAARAGVALGEFGLARAGMGVDAADYDWSGRPGLVIGNFSTEMMSLYHNEGNGLFIDEAPRSSVGKESLFSLTFGCFFFDYDLDGWLDMFAANGHVIDEIAQYNMRLAYRQRPHLFRNLGQKRFAEAITSVGPDLARAVVGRGAAYADIDNDGDLDLLVVENGGPARLYRNDGGNANHALRVKLVGTRSNRDGIGARVELVAGADGIKPWAIVKTGSSYASQSELPLTFGLGSAARVAGVKVRWPGGLVDTVGGIDADQVITVKEGAGVVEKAPLRRTGR